MRALDVLALGVLAVVAARALRPEEAAAVPVVQGQPAPSAPKPSAPMIATRPPAAPVAGPTAASKQGAMAASISTAASARARVDQPSGVSTYEAAGRALLFPTSPGPKPTVVR